MTNFFMAVIIGLIFILTFAGFFLMKDEGRTFKRKQTQEGAAKSFDKMVRAVSSLYNFETTGKTTLRFGSDEYTFDEILLSEYGTIAVNAVYRNGDVYGAANDDEWVCIPSDGQGKKERFENPVKQQNGCVRFFRDMYKQEKVKGGNTDSMVVFPFGRCIIYITPRNTNAFTLANFRTKLGDAKYRADNKADVSAMKSAIEKYTVK